PEHLAQIAPEIVERANPYELWGPGEDAHQGQQNHDAQPEDRHRQASDAKDTADVVQPGITPDATDGAQGDPDDDGDRHGVHCQIDRNGEMFDDQCLDGLVGDEERSPQVALHDIPGPASVLYIPRIVEPHLLTQRRDALCIGAVTEDRDGHVPWNHPHDSKNEPGDSYQGNDGKEEAADDELLHTCSPGIR